MRQASNQTLYEDAAYLWGLLPDAYGDGFVPFNPVLSEQDAYRLSEVIAQIATAPDSGARIAVVRAAFEETDGRAYRYRAALAVLLDLMRHEYVVKVEDGRLHVAPTTLATWRGSLTAYKEFQRRHLLQERDQQLREPSVQKFLCELETPRRWRGEAVSIHSLIGDPQILIGRQKAAATSGELPVSAYVQEVTTTARDEHTGLRLQDIWRYFRHTWTIPYNSTPGRNIQFLVRDSAQPRHPIVGLLGLGSSMIQITARDNYLGWTVEAVARRFATEANRERQSQFLRAMRASLKRARDEVRHVGVISRKAVPTASTVAVLEGRLREIEEVDREQVTDRQKRTPREESETPLFQKKRAKAILRVFRAQLVFDTVRRLPVPDQVRILTTTPEGRFALGVALQEQKKRLVGSGMMDIVVCGAIPPYTYVLGGKLVAMLATSPTVVAAYKRRYSRAPSEIASAMAGRPIVRPAELVFLGTTSLYETHSSQYERIVLPEELGGLRYVRLGKTLGFSSVQFTKQTRDLLATVSERTRGRRVVSHKFGEGVNPKLRAISAGLTDLGLDGNLLRYSSRRLVYGVLIAGNAREVLLGEARRPRYYWTEGSDAEKRIVEFWTRRWCIPRFGREGVAESLSSFSSREFTASLHPTLPQKPLTRFLGDGVHGSASPTAIEPSRQVETKAHPVHADESANAGNPPLAQ